jgi:hypothetical protein
MKRLFLLSALVLVVGSAHAHETDRTNAADRASSDRDSTVEFTSASGRPLGSVTRIGGVTYFADADGRLLGTAETIDGRKVYRSY